MSAPENSPAEEQPSSWVSPTSEMPVVPLPADPFIPRRPLQRLVNLFPPGQFLRYIAVGVFNTVFGFSIYALLFWLFTNLISVNHPSLLAPLASIVSTPLNITVAYFGYKLFVFKTRGNYLAEWLKCFGVYGLGMLPGLIVLSGLTRLLLVLLVRYAPALHHPPTVAAYLAGALVTGFTAIASFVGHKKVTFATKSPGS
jgi:putative flippase GtrA